MIVWLLKPAQLTALEMFNLNIVSTATNWSDQRCIAEHPRPFGHNIEQKWRRAVLMLELRWKVTTRENKMWKGRRLIAIVASQFGGLAVVTG